MIEWISGLSGRARLLVALGLGATLTLGQPPYSLPLAVFLAVPGLLLLVDAAPGPRAAAVVGWGAGFGYFASSLYWVGNAFLVDAADFAWMLPFAVTLLPAGLALIWAAGFAAARAIWPTGRRGAGLWRALALAVCWTLAEYARGHMLTGFPWGLIGYAWIETPVMQSASVVGSYGLSFATLLLAALPGAALGGARRTGAATIAVTALLVAGAWGWGAHRLDGPAPARADGFLVRIVHPSVPQREKWIPEKQRGFFQTLRRETSAPASAPPDVVIWPETAVPFMLEKVEARTAIAAFLPPGASLITGAQRAEQVGGVRLWRNSLFMMNDAGEIEEIYDKRHLVPFGEYLPFQSALEAIGLRQLTQLRGGFTPGDVHEVLHGAGAPPFTPLICYEAIFPDEVGATDERPQWLVNITNDAWFGTGVGPFQHLAQSRARAIEQGLPLARSSNTGVSAMIDPFGRLTARLDSASPGHFDALLPAALAPTTFARFGEWPILITLIIGFIGLSTCKYLHLQ